MEVHSKVMELKFNFEGTENESKDDRGEVLQERPGIKWVNIVNNVATDIPAVETGAIKANTGNRMESAEDTEAKIPMRKQMDQGGKLVIMFILTANGWNNK